MMKNNKLGLFLILVGSFYSVLTHADTIKFPQDPNGTVTLAKNLHQSTDGKLDGWRLIKDPDNACHWITYKNNIATKKEDAICESWLASQHPITINTPNGITEIALPLVAMADNTYSESVVAQVNFDNQGNIYNVKVNRGSGSIINLENGPDIMNGSVSTNYSSRPMNITIKTSNGEITKIDVPQSFQNNNTEDKPIIAQVNFDKSGNVSSVKNRAKGDSIDLEKAFSEEYTDSHLTQYNEVSLELRQKIVNMRIEDNLKLENVKPSKTKTDDTTDDVYVRRSLLNLP